ncbi:methyltransferase domain-containing protein [Aquibium sp. LZ166]|uniref:Methyltransferase domain-containing protein n=2 Tax=Aquibium pacificus TaxID=3153579 RepID=A0ABV3SSF0_9HYPH
MAISDIYSFGVSHNPFPLTLPDGTYYPDYITTVDTRPIEFLTHFNRVRSNPWSDSTFLDLGCSEGSTTMGLAQMGSTVYGVEGRAEGVNRARFLASLIDFDRTHFSVGNVNDPASYPEVDGVFNAGILYHLEDPVLCLERCASSARSFIYLDTGHSLDDDELLKQTKFAANFGERFTIDYNGLKLNAMNFAEPSDREEKQEGRRRGPRSGIGNSNSIWLSQQSAIDLMIELGFPYHETIRAKLHIPRYRTVFFREKPRDVEPLGNLRKPLPTPAPRQIAIRNARDRDIAYIKSSRQSVTVFGREPLLSGTIADLQANEISVGEVIRFPGTGKDFIASGAVATALNGRSGLIVIAFEDQKTAAHRIMLLDTFSYIFTSIATSSTFAGQ